MFCNKCGNSLPDTANFCTKCGEQTELLKMLMPAPLEKRLLNLIIDVVAVDVIVFIFSLIGTLFGGSVGSAFQVIGILSFFGYHLICESIWQRTLGKLITKTKVVTRDGTKPSFWAILGRSLARYIPFESLSFLFSSFPVGWHDSLSNTVVVPAIYTADDVKNINYKEAKKTKGSNILIVVVVVLVIIAIIGVLASIVLTSLTTARAKGQDAIVKTSIANIRMQGKIYEATHEVGGVVDYSDFCEGSDVVKLIETMAKIPDANPICNDSKQAYASDSGLHTKKYYCVDSIGEPIEVFSKLGSGATRCARE